jgi:ATP-dependent helicase/nuclease subunit A
MMPRPLPDEAARRRAGTELDRTFIVEAGAGTGKTRLLVDRIEHLVASGTVPLRNVVAITFTEKAAAELRVQIRLRIESRLGGPPPVAPLFQAALEDLEIAPISTIHAFAADLLRERPVEAGVDPGFAVADELTASLLRTEAWDRWLEQEKGAGEAVLRDAVDLGVSLKRLRALGDALLRHRDLLESGMDRGDPPSDPIAWLASAEPIIRGCIARIGTDCYDESDAGVADLRALERALDLFARLGASEVRRTVLGELKLKIRGSQGKWAKDALADIKQQLSTLRDELDALRSTHAHYVAAGAADLLSGYVAEYRSLKAREGNLDFHDLLLAARNLLRDRLDVRAYFQGRFGAILVDEFQDTDPLQAEIIFFLAEDGARAEVWDQVRLRPGKLFLVGDPKQSIYAFRRADIETYERAKEVLLRSGEVLYITANFRSVEPIIDAVNGTFRGKMRRPDDGAYQPDYVPLSPCPTTRSPDGPALTLLYPNDPEAGDANVLTLRRQEADALAAFLRQAIDAGRWQIGDTRRPARFGDIALLFRGMGDVPAYEDAFKRYEIPYRVTSSRTYYKREEIGWLLNVLHAVEHPTDAVAVWGALRSPVFGCSDREVYEYVAAAGGRLDYRDAMPQGPESLASAFAILRELHGARLWMSVPRMVEHVLVRTDARATFLLTPQGEQRAANLNKLTSLARALEESGLLTFRAFVHWLRDMEEQAVDEAESPTVEEGDDVVRIMSIHAAKGLEFPIVVIPDLGRGPGGGADHLLVQRTRGTVAAHLDKIGEWAVQTRDYGALKAQHAVREAAERLRVLYVAMTRARDGLIIPVFPDPAGGSLQEDLQVDIPAVPEFGKSHNGWLMVDGQEAPRAVNAPAPVRLRLPDGTTPEGDAAAAARRAWVLGREAAIASAGTPDLVRTPSSLVDHRALISLRRRGAALESEPGGQKLGALVHAVLAALPANRPDLVDEFVRYGADQRRLDESVRRRAVELVRAALANQSVRTALSGPHWREAPFAKVGPGGVVEGAVDVVADEGDGVTVLDFKTDAVTNQQQAELENVYSAQIKEYLDVVRSVGSKGANGELIFLSTPDRDPT